MNQIDLSAIKGAAKEQAAKSRIRKPKWCKRCGGKHSGECKLVFTSRGTLARVEITEKVESRYQEQGR